MKLSRGSITARRDGRYAWEYLARSIDPATGQAIRQRRQGTAPTRAQATAAMHDDKRQIQSNAPRSPGDPAPSARDAAQLYVNHKRQHVSPKHASEIKATLNALLDGLDPRLPLGQITDTAALAFRRRYGHLKPISLHNRIACVRHFLRWAADPRRALAPPGLERHFPIPRVPDPNPIIATVADIERVLPHMRPLARDLILLAYHTAARWSELRTLRRADVQYASARECPKITRTLDGLWITHATGHATKTGKNRFVPLNPDAAAIVQRRLDQTPDAPGALLFPSPRTGRPLGNLKVGLRAASRRARLPYTLNFKVLRHTACTELAKLVTPAIHAAIAGHSVHTAMRYYVRIDTAAQRAALDAIPRPRMTGTLTGQKQTESTKSDQKRPIARGRQGHA